ncbi:MAG: sigma-70 family RNA polymerase sigma factor [Planctomycetota bacterium]|nr:sigma-70 family RNA polymerase sigma factor [Planctomycetota bacterium]
MADRASKTLVDNLGDGGDESGSPQAIAFADAALIERCRSGDMQAFALLVAKYQDRVFNMVFRLCGNRADAEELAQEAFLKALAKLRQFRGQSGFYTWLFRIAANLTISHRRRRGRIRFHSLDGPEDCGERAGLLTAAAAGRREPNPQAAAMSAETAQRVNKAIAELDDEYRLVVVLRDIEEMNYAQIADVLNVPAGTVKSRLHRARRILSKKLQYLVG